MSTLQDTHLFRLDSASTIFRVEPASTGFVTNLPTLAVSNVPRRFPPKSGQPKSVYADSSLVVQVTPKEVNLLEFDISLEAYAQVGGTWTPEKLADIPNGANQNRRGREIVAASINASQVAIAISGARLVLLNMTDKNQFQILA